MTTAHYLVTVHLNIDLPLALLQSEPTDAPMGLYPNIHACQNCNSLPLDIYKNVKARS